MTTLNLPPEYAELGEKRARLLEEGHAIEARRRELRKAAIEAAGWKRCCRCFPSCVSNSGYCGCCYFNHVTGEQDERPAPFHEEPAVAVGEPEAQP